MRARRKARNAREIGSWTEVWTGRRNESTGRRLSESVKERSMSGNRRNGENTSMSTSLKGKERRNGHTTANESVTMTGTIGEDGSIGPVSGVLEKARAAAASGKTLLILPEGNDLLIECQDESRSLGGLRIAGQRPVVVDAKEYIEENLGIHVRYANSIDDLVADVRDPPAAPATTPI